MIEDSQSGLSLVSLLCSAFFLRFLRFLAVALFWPVSGAVEQHTRTLIPMRMLMVVQKLSRQPLGTGTRLQTIQCTATKKSNKRGGPFGSGPISG